jgi:hypothetical protein
MKGAIRASGHARAPATVGARAAPRVAARGGARPSGAHAALRGQPVGSSGMQPARSTAGAQAAEGEQSQAGASRRWGTARARRQGVVLRGRSPARRGCAYLGGAARPRLAAACDFCRPKAGHVQAGLQNARTHTPNRALCRQRTPQTHRRAATHPPKALPRRRHDDCVRGQQLRGQAQPDGWGAGGARRRRRRRRPASGGQTGAGCRAASPRDAARAGG